MSKNGISDKLWRLVKVLYFLFTIPTTIIVYIMVSENFWIKKQYGSLWHEYYSVGNYYKYLFYGLLVIILYLVITDALSRISHYIGSGKSKGRIPYKYIFKQFRYVVIIGVGIVGSLYRLQNNFTNKINTYCSEKGAVLKSDKSCICEKGYDMIDGKCKISRNTFIYENLQGQAKELFPSEQPYIETILLDATFLNKEESKGMGLIVKSQSYFNLDQKEDISGISYDTLFCGTDIQGLSSVYGKGILVLFSVGEDDSVKIDDIKEVPGNDLSYPIFNTKKGNFKVYGGEKPSSEMEGNKLERTKIINWRDLDGDGVKNEFVIINYEICGLNSYLVVGYELNTNSIKLYEFKSKYYNDNYWNDNYWIELTDGSQNNFSGGVIHQETYCGTNIGGSEDSSWDYVYNPQTQIFEQKNYKSRKCRENELY